MRDLIVTAGWVVTGIKDRFNPEIVEGGAVLSRDGTVVAIGSPAELQQLAPTAEVRAYPNHVMLPGFVNSHHHVGMTPLQLGSPDLALELWFAGRIPARRLDLLSGHALLGFRNDRLGRHDGPAYSRLDARPV